MFNESEILIMINGKDRTKDIKNYELNDDFVTIIFLNYNTPYSYAKSHVDIYLEPKNINLEKYRIYQNGKPLLNKDSINI